MAEKKSAKKSPARKKPAAKPAPRKKTTAKAPARKAPAVAKAAAPAQPAARPTKVPPAKPPAKAAPRARAHAPASGEMSLSRLKPARGSWPKRTRVGRGHGSGMVKTGGEGGKGQTVRSGGGKGPAFEGGQTPWARRLPHRRGYSQKARDIGHFRTEYAVVNLHQLSSWDPSVEVSPESLCAKGVVKQTRDGVKILGGAKSGKSLPSGLRFRDVLFSGSAREALTAAGASFEEGV
jgi:large subunit ribosomal protein L15